MSAEYRMSMVYTRAHASLHAHGYNYAVDLQTIHNILLAKHLANYNSLLYQHLFCLPFTEEVDIKQHNFVI